ncbi:hypothetical protein Btru_034982 [Bulinus truncatus]|nr:hypothetical protein Btru_034982 [Bulinus truncatus]
MSKLSLCLLVLLAGCLTGSITAEVKGSESETGSEAEVEKRAAAAQGGTPPPCTWKVCPAPPWLVNGP